MKLPCMGARKRHLLARKSPFLGKKSPFIGKEIALYWAGNLPLLGTKTPIIGQEIALYWAWKSSWVDKKSPPVGKKFALLGLENRPFGTRKSPFVGKELALLELENLRHLCCQEVKSHLVSIKRHVFCKINIQHPNQLQITKLWLHPTNRKIPSVHHVGLKCKKSPYHRGWVKEMGKKRLTPGLTKYLLFYGQR